MKYNNMKDIKDAKIPLDQKTNAFEEFYFNYQTLKPQIGKDKAREISMLRVNNLLESYVK